MAKTNIPLPEHFIFSTTYAVKPSDLNFANHVAAERILGIAIDTQYAFFEHFGYMNPIDIEGTALILSNSEIQFLSELKYGDILSINVMCRDFFTYGFDLIYVMSTRSSKDTSFDKSNDNKPIAIIKTGVMTFDYQQQKIAELPVRLKQKLSPDT